jgi:hypothetical protein
MTASIPRDAPFEAGRTRRDARQSALPHARRDVIAKLEAKLRALEADAQEAAIARLPDSNRAFCEAKGRLYFIIKDIINAARALHAAEPELATKYNLKALYQRGTKKEMEAPAPAPAAAPGA